MEERSIGYRRFESNYDVDQSQIEIWVDKFHKEGFLFLPQVLTNDHCQQLRSDLEWSLENNPNGLNSGDTLAPFCTSCEHYYNLKCEYDELRDGGWTHIELKIWITIS